MVEHNDERGSSAPQPTPDVPGSAGGLETRPASSTPQDAPKHPLFPIVIGVVLLIVLVIAWVFSRMSAESSAAAPAGTAPGTAEAPAAKPAEPDPMAVLSDGVKSLKSDVEGFKADLKALQERLEAMPKPTPAPDLDPLNSKVAALSKSTEALADLPKKVEDLNQRIGSFDTTLASLRGDIDTLKSEVKTAAASGSEAPKPSGDANVALAVLDPGVDLFKAGKYKEASDAFRKLTESNPNDARVWYYAAISRGSATKDWAGETLRMVEKGVELEKAGTPEGARIDAALADLNPTFKNWLDAYRKGARTR
jgi:TolA-binding protein